MKLPVVNHCCCGCGLEFGSKVIAWLQLFGGLFSICCAIVGLVQDNSQLTSCTFLVIFSFISLGLSITLLIAIKKQIARNVRVWVIISTIILLLYTLSLIVQCTILMVNGGVTIGLWILAMGLLLICIQLYCIIIVRSFGKEISKTVV